MKTSLYLVVSAPVLLVPIGNLSGGTMSDLEPQVRESLKALKQYGEAKSIAFEE